MQFKLEVMYNKFREVCVSERILTNQYGITNYMRLDLANVDGPSVSNKTDYLQIIQTCIELHVFKLHHSFQI